tara:strand:- start:103 stop:348 length:246 start_codon:yes stop_codon:yes gene_type:complete
LIALSLDVQITLGEIGMTKLHDMSLPHLLSLLSRLERMVKIMAIITIASTAFYILNYLVMSNNPELDPQRIEAKEDLDGKS